jgi:hypothetical protein
MLGLHDEGALTWPRRHRHQAEGRALLRAVREAVDVSNGQHRRAGSALKHRHPALKTHIGFGDPTQEGRGEHIDGLAGLPGEVRQPLLQRRIHSDGGFRHDARPGVLSPRTIQGDARVPGLATPIRRRRIHAEETVVGVVGGRRCLCRLTCNA